MFDGNQRDFPEGPIGDSGDEPNSPGGGGGMDEPATQDAVGLRVGRNPANLGDDVPESTDVTYPNPEPEVAPQI
jgi:hypothetical protein